MNGQQHAILAVVVYSTEAVVNLARGEYEAILLAVSDQLLEQFFLCHSIY